MPILRTGNQLPSPWIETYSDMKTIILLASRLFCVLILTIILMVSSNCPAQVIDEKAEKEKAEEKTQQHRNAEKLFLEIENKRKEKESDENKLANAESSTPAAPKKDEKPKGEVFPVPDRTVLRPLEQAKQLIDRNRIGDAVPIIGSILEGDVDFFYDLQDDSSRTTGRTFKQTAEELFRLLPEEGREQYDLQYGPVAKSLLGKAVESGSVELIEKVANSYFFTQSGQEATFLLAVYQYDQGARASALLLLRKILAETDSIDSYEPTFSLTLAACEKSLGQQKSAESTLEKFFKNNPNPRIWIGGDQFWNPKNVQEMLDKLQTWESEPDVANWLENSGWLLSSGEPANNPELLSGPPLLEKLWKQITITKPKQASILRLTEGVMRQDRTAPIPATRPIYVGGLLIYKGFNEVVAVDPSTGKRVWVGKESDYRLPISATTFFQNFNYIPQFPKQLPMVLLRMQLWYNQTLGNLSSDGNTVFSIEDEPDVTKSHIRALRGVVRVAGANQIEDPRERVSTTITARDAKTGEVIWQVGKTPLVQKMLDQIENQLHENHKKQQEEQNQQRQNAIRARQAVPPLPPVQQPAPAPGLPPAPVLLPPAPVLPRGAMNVPVQAPNNLLIQVGNGQVQIQIQANVEKNGEVVKKNDKVIEIDPWEGDLGKIFKENLPAEEPAKTDETEKDDAKEENADAQVEPEENVLEELEIPLPPASFSNEMIQKMFAQTGIVQVQLAPIAEPAVEGKTEQAVEHDSKMSDETSKKKIEITADEQLLGDTYFLGAPLPVLDNLYVLGENSGLIRLFVLEKKTGRLVRHIPLVEPSTAIETDWLRRFRGPSPSYSEGILVCPTAAGAVIAFEPTSGRLLWSYNYSDKPSAQEVELMRQMGRGNVGFGMIIPPHYGNGMPFVMNGSSEDFKYISDYVGWTHPSATIHKGKLIFAPADKPALFCIDLLTGELLWKRSKGKAKYVAGIHKEKVLIVAQDSMIALDLNTGSAIWGDSDLKPLPPKAPPTSNLYGGFNRQLLTPSGPNTKQEAQKNDPGLPQVVFPNDSVATGIGIRYQDKYMLPLSDKTVVVIDLNEGKISKIWKSLDNSELGNLLSIGGKVFSQTASSVESFHQIDLLRIWANDEIQANSDDPEALYQLGRLSAAEGDREKALQFFQKGFEIQPNAKNRAALRSVLTELFDQDFGKYRVPLEEIEGLKDSPDSLGAILHAYANGCVRIGDYPEFAVAFRKILDLDRDYHLLRKIDSANQIRLARWIGVQVRTFSKQPELADVIASFAREEFERIEKLMNADPSEKPSTETIAYQWKQYLEYFGSLPQSEKAGEKLFRIYLAGNRFSDMEFLLGLPNSSLLPPLEIVKNESGESTPEQSNTDPADDSFSMVFRPEIRASLVNEVAKKFESEGNFQSAFHYYKVLDTQFNSTEFVPFVSNDSEAKTTGIAVFEKLNDNPDISPLMHTKAWPGGEVDFAVKDTEITSNTNRIEATHVIGVGQGFSNSNVAVNIPIPCDSTYSPFMGDQLFTRMIVGQEKTLKLVAWNENGEENWSLELPSDENEDNNVSQYPVMYGVSDSFYSGLGGYIKCYNHIVYYVTGKKVYAIDTLKRDKQGAATLLWHKTAQANIPVPAHILMGNNVSQPSRSYVNQSGLVDPIYINSHIFCLHDFNLIHGIDPLTGETLWVRDSLANSLFITGDDRYIYLIRPKFGIVQTISPYINNGRVNTQDEVVVLESETAEEVARGNAPAGIYHVLGSKLVCLENNDMNSRLQKIAVYDLRDYISLEKNTNESSTPQAKRAIALTTRGDTVSTPPIKPKYSRTLGNTGSVYNLYKQGRVLGILVATGVTLLDLETLEPLAPVFKFPSTISGTVPPRPGSQQYFNFHVEFDGSDVVIAFINSQNQQQLGNRVDRASAAINRMVLQNVATLHMPRGQVMRYDAQANQLWDKPVAIDNWFICNNSERYPVILFGATFQQTYPGESVLTYPVVWGMDKKTGEKRFSKKITSSVDNSASYNSFDRNIFFTKVYVDPKMNQIIFKSQRQWSVVATFTDKTALEVYNDENLKTISPSKFLRGLSKGLMRQIIPSDTFYDLDLSDWEFWLPF